MSAEPPGSQGQVQIPGYEIGERIGKGGMGEVYRARQIALNRQVAVKLMTLDAETDPAKQIERFRHEAELMAGVSHPNIVSVFDFGIADGHPYLVMEHIEGGDLRSRMTSKRPMRTEQVRAVVRPVARALAYLHRLGILHRDLKPENILLHHEDNPKVTDFGIAVLHADSGPPHRTNPRAGTLGYVAPEQHYGLKVDERSDQYSLAALTYEMLTGHLPLGVFRAPTEHNRRLSAEVDTVLMRALEEDGEDRYPTVTEFADALDRALEQVGPRSGRRVALASIGALGILAGAIVLGAGRSSSGRLDAQPRFETPRVEAVRGKSQSKVAESAAGPKVWTNGIAMELVVVPPGEFKMGSPDSDKDAEPEEKPAHGVTISRAFSMGRYEVTVGQFRTFVDATGYQTEAESSGLGGSVFDQEKRDITQDPKWSWRNPGHRVKGLDDHPVVQVSWNDAMEFCQWLSKKEGRTYRLPTEAEWEYACRAGSTTRWCMGDSVDGLGEYAWVPSNSSYTIHRVGRRKPNAFGLYDMHGNVWEWCLDWHGPYPSRDEIDPTGGEDGWGRVLRGGPYDWAVEKSRSAARLSHEPSSRYMTHGFRVVCLGTDAG